MWGFVIGGAAIAATATSTMVLRATRGSGAAVAFGAALIGAYAVYELVLLAATRFLRGAEDFTVSIVGRLGALNFFWTVGLVAACEVVRLYGVAMGPQSAR